VILGPDWNKPKKAKKKKSKGLFGRRSLAEEASGGIVPSSSSLSSLSSSLSSSAHMVGYDISKLPPPLHRQGGPAPAVNLSYGALKYVPTVLDHTFAISQSWRCAPRGIAIANQLKPPGLAVGEKGATDSTGAPLPALTAKKGIRRSSFWRDCDKTSSPPDILSVMGYSMRTKDFRYTAWFHYDRKKALPILDVAPFEEEVSECLITGFM
jgi:hypothetical protein